MILVVAASIEDTSAATTILRNPSIAKGDEEGWPSSSTPRVWHRPLLAGQGSRGPRPRVPFRPAREATNRPRAPRDDFHPPDTGAARMLKSVSPLAGVVRPDEVRAASRCQLRQRPAIEPTDRGRRGPDHRPGRTPGPGRRGTRNLDLTALRVCYPAVVRGAGATPPGAGRDQLTDALRTGPDGSGRRRERLRVRPPAAVRPRPTGVLPAQPYPFR